MIIEALVLAALAGPPPNMHQGVGHIPRWCDPYHCLTLRTRRHMRRVRRPYRGWLASVRGCEVRGQPRPYKTDTGNRFYGAYQFTAGTWHSLGARGLPHEHFPLEQDYYAVRLRQRDGIGAWPICG